ncbi:MAG: aspartate aminotransferase family protein, partial [Anaerolineales bacterium]
MGPALVGTSMGIQLPQDLAFIATHGLGPHLYGANGKTYLDLVMGYGPLVLGHAHPIVVEAVASQMARGPHFYAPNQPASALAERIGEFIPTAERVQFTGSGAEATFYALRLARAFSGRDRILKFEGAYHGHHDYALHAYRRRDTSSLPFASAESAGIPKAISETVLVAPFNDLEATRRIVAEHGPVAAILVEPVQRAIMPVPGFLEGLRELCDATDSLLLFDEIVTGFRLALGGAQQAFGVRPDLTMLGKALGGGLPIAAVVGRQDIIDLSSARSK